MPTAGFTDPEGVIALGKFWLFTKPVKSWGSVPENALASTSAGSATARPTA